MRSLTRVLAWRWLAVLVVCVGLVGCVAAPSPSPISSGLVASPSGSPSSTPSLTAAPTPPGASKMPTVAADPPPLALELVTEDVDRPIGITADPDGRLLVNEQVGRIVAIGPDGSASPFADLTDRIIAGGERGLLGLALHPGWPAVPRAFVHYTDFGGDTAVSEFAASGQPLALDTASEQLLLRVDQPYANHNGGQLSFGPDGLLYLGLGDGGSGGDPHGHGQDASTLLGSIIRIDVDAAAPYAIPADNPFATGGGAPEVWLMGLRNPWRFSFDRLTGQLWIGDVGQAAWEEIDRVDPTAGGANLGWNIMEGAHCFAIADCDSAAYVGPLAEYPNGEAGCAVTGGYVYRGTRIAGLAGWYLFSDFCSGTLFAVPSDAAQPVPGTALAPRVILESGLGVASFGEGVDGELYVADAGGAVYRIVPGG
jgi:glucose/arabinose dehydrogenase